MNWVNWPVFAAGFVGVFAGRAWMEFVHPRLLVLWRRWRLDHGHEVTIRRGKGGHL